MTWQPDRHRDPYVWIAALGGHLAIGVALWLAPGRYAEFWWNGTTWVVLRNVALT